MHLSTSLSDIAAHRRTASPEESKLFQRALVSI